MNRHWQRLLLPAGAALVPAALVLAIGWLAIRREHALALHDAREAAGELAVRAADQLRVSLLEPPLPSAADLSAWILRPSGPDDEPCRRIAREHGGALALHIAGNALYPPASPIADPSYVGRPLDPDTVEPAVLGAWEAAAQAGREPGRDTAARLAAWDRALALAEGSTAEGAVRLGAGQARFAAGQFREATELFESVAAAPTPWASETGIPANYLALRALMQIEELEPSVSHPRAGASAADRLCHLVLVRLRLPDALLDELSGEAAKLIPAWREVARDHARILATFVPLRAHWAEPATGVSGGEWIEVEGGEAQLLSSHRGTDATWWLLRSPDRLVALAEARLVELGLPRHLSAEITFAGRPLRTNAITGPLLGFAASSGRHPGVIQVGLHLARPEMLEADLRRRTGRITLVVGIATVFAGVASLATVRALLRQRRLTELQTDFVASVTHELRAPLAAIQLIADELVDLPEAESVRRTSYSQLILREVRRLGFLIENVLLHARLERGAQRFSRVPVDLGELLDATREGLLPIAREREVEISVNRPAESQPVSGDAGALRQVLVNLVDNALKHAPPRSAVELALEFASASGAPPVARITVADHGPGIPREDQARIFEQFYRRGSELRRETAGVGLGLAIARRLVFAHGGTLEVRSEPGRGARFTVTLPAR